MGRPVNPQGGKASRGEARNRPGGVTGDSGDLPAVRADYVRSVPRAECCLRADPQTILEGSQVHPLMLAAAGAAVTRGPA